MSAEERGSASDSLSSASGGLNDEDRSQSLDGIQESLLNGKESNASNSASVRDSERSEKPESYEPDVAFAAHAAALAMSESDAARRQEDSLPQRCRICDQGGEEDGRPLLRFLPVEHDISAATASPLVTTFTEDISLHIFCGKTASILPSVNRPDLEILSKAGLKNKHGIGSEVNAALARTRCAILAQEGAKEKHFYLVREFEAHLAAVRHTHITYGTGLHAGVPGSLSGLPPPDLGFGLYGVVDPTQHLAAVAAADPYAIASVKDRPVRAAAGEHAGLKRHHLTQVTGGSLLGQPPLVADMENGKVKCGCGGRYTFSNTTKGMNSFQAHIATKRHQKWMKKCGNVGAV